MLKQFWRNVDDRDVFRFLKLFTNIDIKEIIALESNKNTNINNVKIDLANIGTSSKDFSSAHLHSAIFNQVETCVEVKQKKQEFGGAFLGVNNLLCEGINVIDTNSIFQKNKS